MQLNDKTFNIGILRRRRRFWVNFFQTSSAFGDLLDLSDHPLLLDTFSLGPPQLRTGLVFLFCFKVDFEKHPTDHRRPQVYIISWIIHAWMERGFINESFYHCLKYLVWFADQWYMNIDHLSCICSYVYCYEFSMSSKWIGDHCYERPFSYMMMYIIMSSWIISWFLTADDFSKPTKTTYC